MSLGKTSEEPSNMVDVQEFISQYRMLILSKCQIDQNTDCLIWHGAISHTLYSKISYMYKIQCDDGTLKSCRHYTQAHRLIYACVTNSLYLLDKAYRHIEISHLCHNRLCCNIIHLEAETKQMNSNRTKCKRQSLCTDHDPPCILFASKPN